MMPRTPRPHWVVGLLVPVLALVLGAGCGSPPPSGSVNGKVTDNGKPFDGKIVFMAGGSDKEQKMVEVPIQGGRYEVSAISPGAKEINIFKAGSPENPNQDPNRQNGFWVANPRTVEIQPGSQSIDFKVTRLAP
jgi:hypothetical protein